MDLDDWELLPDYGFLEIHGVGSGGAKKIFSTKYDVSSDPTDDFKTDYFSCPSPKSDAREVTRPPKQVIHLPVQLEPSSSSSAREIVFFDQKVESPKFETEHDDIVSQVSFKNITRENEFVEMKMDSPKSRSRSPLPQQIDLDSFQFEMENDNNNCEVEQVKTEAKHDESDIIGGLNIWKRSLNGIGAICSFGVAAATFCFIVLGTQQKKNKKDIRFQIYADDKGFCLYIYRGLSK